MVNKFDKILETLTPREEKIIKLICEKKSLSEISKHFDISDERVFQIITKAIRKIKYRVNMEKICICGKLTKDYNLEGLTIAADYDLHIRFNNNIHITFENDYFWVCSVKCLVQVLKNNGIE